MINIQNYKKIITCVWVFLLTSIGVVACFNEALAVGFLLIFVLSSLTLFTLYKIGLRDKKMYQIFLIALLIHLMAVLFIYSTGFHPFSGGADFETYHITASEIFNRFSQGNFSLEGLRFTHYFPIIIGILYIFTLPEMIVGQSLTVWLAGMAVLFTYLIVKEISNSRKWAFLIGLIVSIYPSYVFFGSVLLKDTIIIPLVLCGILLSIKMFKNFSWQKFLIFYIILTALIHFRFYVGFALLFSFIFSWFLVSRFDLNKRVVYGFVFIFLLGFSPYMLDYGYYGVKPLQYYLRQDVITIYREVVYAPPKPVAAPAKEPVVEEPVVEEPVVEEPVVEEPVVEEPVVEEPVVEEPVVEEPVVEEPVTTSGKRSSFLIKTGFDEGAFGFTKNSLNSFIHSLLGPFPWQLKTKQHFFALFEMIPWYCLFSFIIIGAYRVVTNKKYRFALPLLIFSIIALGALSLFINNFGIIVRIRISMFISLLCLLPFGFGFSNFYLKKGENYCKKIYNKLWKSI